LEGIDNDLDNAVTPPSKDDREKSSLKPFSFVESKPTMSLFLQSDSIPTRPNEEEDGEWVPHFQHQSVEPVPQKASPEKIRPPASKEDHSPPSPRRRRHHRVPERSGQSPSKDQHDIVQGSITGNSSGVLPTPEKHRRHHTHVNERNGKTERHSGEHRGKLEVKDPSHSHRRHRQPRKSE
jgi:hypothetical protein